jgi:hypothetical protein
MVAVRKDHGNPLPGSKRRDALQIILVQVKGGGAASGISRLPKFALQPVHDYNVAISVAASTICMAGKRFVPDPTKRVHARVRVSDNRRLLARSIG